MIIPSKIKYCSCTLMLLPLFFTVSFPVFSESIWSDPLRTANDLSNTPATSLIGSCGFDIKPPNPLTLLDAVERALCRNPQTREAWANVKAQTAALGVSRSSYLPRLTAGGSWGKSDNRYTYSDSPDLNTSLNTHSSNVNLNLSWVLYDFGLRAANLESSQQLLNAGNATQDDVLQSVFLSTVQSFYQAQAAQAMLNAAVDAELAAQQIFKASEAKYQASVGSLADKLQTQTAYAQETLKRTRAAGDLKNATGILAIAMGLRPNTALVLADLNEQVKDVPLLRQAVDDLIAEAARNHPKILAAQAQLTSAEAQIKVAHAQGMPTLSLFVTADRNDTPINQVSSKQTITSNSIGLQISIPLFDGFDQKYNVRGAQAKAESKQANLESIEQQVTLDVWKSYQRLCTEVESLNATDILLRSAKQSFDVAQGRYKAGVGNIIELLKAQSELATAQQQRILALTSWQTARLQLAASLGRLQMDQISSP